MTNPLTIQCRRRESSLQMTLMLQWEFTPTFIYFFFGTGSAFWCFSHHSQTPLCLENMRRSKVEVDRYVSSVQNSSPSLKEVSLVSSQHHAIVTDSDVSSSRFQHQRWRRREERWVPMHLLQLASLYVRLVVIPS